MIKYILGRLGQALVTVFLVSLVVFAGVRAIPGDTALALAGEDRSEEGLAAIRDAYGLNKPVWVQYWRWISRAVRGDFGVSARTGAPVSEQILHALPVTLELSVLALAFATIVGIAAGALAAVRRGTFSEWFANGLALLGLSLPNFWFGILLILGFSVAIPLLPASGFVSLQTDPVDNLRRMILPTIVLGSGLAAIVMRQTRSAMLDALSSDYVRTARAKGMPARTVVTGHALRNSLITVVTVLGLQLGHLIAGAVVTEQVFTLPGFGKLTLDGVFTRDYPLIQAVVLVASVSYVLINLGVDLLYSVLDPRIRIGDLP